MLSAVAKETKEALPAILDQLPEIDAYKSSIHNLKDLPALITNDAPGYPAFNVQVVNADTLDTAISLSKEPVIATTASSSKARINAKERRVCILNLASERSPGGGWLNGALAQEESICYRSSLALSLHRKYYPFGNLDAIHTPDVVIIRDEYQTGHQLIDLQSRPVSDLDVVSVVSVAALRSPPTTRKQSILAGEIAERDSFANAEDRELTKSKMRLTLRICALQGHSRIVLGAMGCGAFRNPAEDVAICWREVLGEVEFVGWFERVVFAVLDKGSAGTNAGRGGKGNFDVFEMILGGVRFEGGGEGEMVGE